ncbi:DNA-binding response regulator, partial [Streptomyces sp. HSW2009]
MQSTTTERILVDLRAQDPVSQAGVASQLRARPEVRVIDPNTTEDAQVAIVVVDLIDDEVLGQLRQIQRAGTGRGVLITTHIDEQQLVSAAECGFIGVIRRTEATPER